MKKLTFRQLKIIALVLVMCVTFYPAFELSRCIIKYDIVGGWRAGWQGACLVDFYAELAFIWGLYVLLPFILNWIINLAGRLAGRSNK